GGSDFRLNTATFGSTVGHGTTNFQQTALNLGPGVYMYQTAAGNNSQTNTELIGALTGTGYLGGGNNGTRPTTYQIVNRNSNITVNNGATFGFSGTGTLSSASRINLNSTATLQVENGLGTPPLVTLAGTGNVWGNYVHSAGTINANTPGTAGVLTFNNDLTLS